MAALVLNFVGWFMKLTGKWIVSGLLAGFMTAGATAWAQDAQQNPPQSTIDERVIEDALEAIRNKEFEKGIKMLQGLADQANPDALFHLAELARLGIGGKQSNTVAMMYYRLAGKMGNEKAAMKLANLLYFDGEGTPDEISEALAIWQTYALQDNAEALYLLGIIYWNGENGRTPDPLRGYGLVWRSAESGYNDAVQSELTMRAQLPGEARAAGQAYGERLAELGFTDELIGMDLLVEGWHPDEKKAAEKPDNWATVWRLEVGFAMYEDDANAMLEQIKRDHGELIVGLHSEVVKAPNRIERYRLIFGPFDSMHPAVNLCVSLKRAGFDCFAKPPT